MILEAVLLGLSTGTYCAMYCGPVLIPFLTGTDGGVKRNASLTAVFLAGRLTMYVMLGLCLGSVGMFAEHLFDPVAARKLSYFAYLFSGLALLCSSLGIRQPWNCAGKNPQTRCHRTLCRMANDWTTAALAGLAVGLHLCPPLWTAIARTFFGNGGLSYFYLAFFYAGTLPFFLPLLGIPFLTKAVPALRQIARITQLLIAVYFILMEGLIPLIF